MENAYTRKATVRSERGSNQHEVAIVFDMAGVTEDDLVEAALRTKVIDVQAALRRLSPAELAKVIKEHNGKISRTFKEPGKGIESAEKNMEKMKAMFGGLPKEMQAEFLKSLKS